MSFGDCSVMMAPHEGWDRFLVGPVQGWFGVDERGNVSKDLAQVAQKHSFSRSPFSYAPDGNAGQRQNLPMGGRLHVLPGSGVAQW